VRTLNVDAASLASGAAAMAVGLLVLLDSAGAVDLSLGWIAVLLTGAVGAILVLSGLRDGSRDRHD
jgi:hypothetical protein